MKDVYSQCKVARFILTLYEINYPKDEKPVLIYKQDIKKYLISEFHLLRNAIFKHKSGCEFTKSFKVLTQKSEVIIVPNILNLSTQDEFTIAHPQNHKVSKISIYDRWGNEVYELQNSSTVTWNFALNGDKIMPGVYMYQMQLIDEKGAPYFKLGDITVIR